MAAKLSTTISAWRRIMPLLLLGVHASLLLYSLRLHSVTIDESAHIPSGLVHWHRGTFGAYRVNPPLTRMIATIPLLFSECRWVDSPEERYQNPYERIEFRLVQPFQQVNRENYHEYICYARLAGVLWSCLAGWVIFRWASELYNYAGGLSALCLYCFEPNILAHAQIMTPDLPCSVVALSAIYVFWKYLKAPNSISAILVGFFLGLALMTKFTLLVFLPVYLLLMILVPAAGTSCWSNISKRVTHILLILAATLTVINMGYLFAGAGRSLGDIPFISAAFTGRENSTNQNDLPPEGGNRLRQCWAGHLPSPVPEDWLRGIDVQRRDFEMMRHIDESFLAGEWRHGGWWYYYLFGLGVKLPIGLILLVLAGIVLALVGHRFAASWQDELVLYVPPIAILILVSSQTGFNHHVRYVLPALPFLIVGAGKMALVWQGGSKTAGIFVAGALLWTIASSLWVYPHSLSYFNEVAGGPKNGAAYLVNSNIDWGQDALMLEEWLQQHPEASPMRFALFTTAPNVAERMAIQPGPDAGQATPDSRRPQPGYYAISVNVLQGMGTLHGFQGQYVPAHSLAYFHHFQPIDRIGYTIYIYHLSPDDCDKFRK